MTASPAAKTVAVIGAGPCGLAAGIALERAGLRAIIFDRSCVTSSIASYPVYMSFFSTAEKISIGGLPFVTAGEKPTRREALAYYRLIVQYFGLTIRQYEPVVSISAASQASRPSDPPPPNPRPRAGEIISGDKSPDPFTVRSQTVRGEVETIVDAVVIATGYFGSPNLLNVPGETLPQVTHIYREGHQAFQRNVVVAGGGNSAVDAALDLWRCGARVTLVHMNGQLDPNVKPWVLPDIANRLKDGSIAVRWNTRVQAIEADTMVVRNNAGTEERLPAQQVYLMTGFTPSSTLLTQVGVKIDKETGIPAHDASTMETNVPGVYVAGVLVSGYDANKVFIENGRNHGDLIAAHLA